MSEPIDPHTPIGAVAFSMIGKYVIVRCYAAGVHAGILELTDGRTCLLAEARRLWRWRVRLGAPDFLSGVATHGLADDSKIGAPVRIALTENCEIIECSSEAEKSIRGFATCTRTKGIRHFGGGEGSGYGHGDGLGEGSGRGSGGGDGTGHGEGDG